MSLNRYNAVPAAQTGVIVRNTVLRNTYILLSMTLLFSAAMATVAMLSNAAPLPFLILLAGTYGLLFLTHALQNSSWGILSVFAFTGFMGYSLGPILNAYLYMYTNGASLIATSLGATGIVFFALSGHVLTSQKDYSYLSGFLFAGVIIAVLAMIGGLLFNIPGFHLAISGLFALISSGMILMQTSEIIHGGERNYIVATVGLYVSIYNLFVSLLHILSAFAGNRD